MKIFRDRNLRNIIKSTRKTFSEGDHSQSNFSKLNLNEKREMLRKNLLRQNTDSPSDKLKETEIKRDTDARTTPKINKMDRKDSRIYPQTPTNMGLKKEDAVNNIRFKGIFERNATDKTTPKLDYIYGINSIKCAISTNQSRIKALYIQKDYNRDDANIKEIISQAKSSNIQIDYQSKDQLDLFTGFREHHGILLKTEQKDYSHIKKNDLFFDSLEKPTGNVFVLLDKVIDPQNFGSIIRSSAFYGVDKVIVNKKSRPSISPAVINVSAGATELIDIYDLKHFKSFVQEASNRGWKVLNTTAKLENVTSIKYKTKARSISINDLCLNKNNNVLITFGSEAKGLEDDIYLLTDYNIFIPPCLNFGMYGKGPYSLVDSLNVGVSVGIILDVVKRKLNSDKI